MKILQNPQNEKLKEIAPEFYDVLSNLGKRILLPEGIVAQSAIAKNKAKKINATLGIATTSHGTMYLEGLQQFFRENHPNDIFPYAATSGKASLRELWKKKIYQDNPSLEGNIIHNPIILQGLTHATSLLAQLFLDQGDKVILPDFCWENYSFIFQERFGAQIARYTFSQGGGLHLTALKMALTSANDKKIMLVFNFPHNPTGYAPNKAEIEEIVAILLASVKEGKTLIVVCDDAYFGLNYEQGIYPESLFGRLVSLHPNLIAVKLDGITKEFYAWGLRIGFLTLAFYSSHIQNAFSIVDRKIQGLIRAELSSISHPLQTIVEKYIQTGVSSKEQAKNKKILQGRYYKLKKLLTNDKYQKVWDYYPFNSGYYFCMKIKGVNAKKLWELLLKKYQVGVIYLDDENLRLAYSSVPEEKLEELLESVYLAHRELCH